VAIDTDRYRPKLGEEGERCASCGVPLASDQRYCLNCGERRGNARIPFMDVMRDEWSADHARERAEAAAEHAEAAAGETRSQRNWTPLIAAAAGGGVALMLGIGFVIGQTGDNAPRQSRPQVIQVGGGTAPNTNASTTTFTSDWPDGQTGWTVQLQGMPKDSTQPDAVAAAKTAATGKGAKEVGALDSDAVDGFDTGQYVVYSGVFDNAKAARARLKEVKGNFPDAKVVQVGGSSGSGSSGSSGNGSSTVNKSDLQNLQNLSPSEYQKRSKKLPDTTVLPGKAPAKDGKAPGGGGGLEAIK
jgi:hypothetical protein